MLADMVSARYEPLTERVVVYDMPPPDITLTEPIYGIVQLLESDWGFIMPGIPTGRRTAHWELTLHGRRKDVVEAEEILPAALTMFYRSDGGSVLGSFLAGMRSAERSTVPQGLASAVLQFSSEVL